MVVDGCRRGIQYATALDQARSVPRSALPYHDFRSSAADHHGRARRPDAWRMSEYGLCRDAVKCRGKRCGLQTSLTDTAAGHPLGLRYLGAACCRVCGKSWTYARTEGTAAEVRKEKS